MDFVISFMLTNYFKTAWRNLVRDKTLSFIKIIGLSLGLTVCLLILLFTKDEVSYDRFHANGHRIYRIIQDWQQGDTKHIIGITNPVMGEGFAHDIASVETFVRLNGRTVTVKRDNDIFTEDPLCVDSTFFSVFSFDLLSGDPKTVLNDIYSVVLSEKAAKKYFGSADVIGKTMTMKLADEFETFQVTGVMEDMPINSSIKTDMLLTMQYNQKYNDNTGWLGGSMNTFLLLSPGADVPETEKRMKEVFDDHTAEFLKERAAKSGTTIEITPHLQPFTEIHLAKQPGPDNGMADGSDPVYSYILSGIAIFILIIACINFINLTIAQSLRRSKEIGVRKVVGGSRKQLVTQFLTESFTISLIAFATAIVLTQAALPLFNNLANKKLQLSYLSDGYLFGTFIILLIVTSLLAGFYPSMVLSAFQPVKVLYNRHTTLSRNFLTKGLIVFQFALAIFLIISATTINLQLDFLFKADLGYDSKNLVRIDIPVSSASDPLPVLFKSELTGKPQIVNVAAKNRGRSISSMKADGKEIVFEKSKIDPDFIPTFGITLVAGRNFSASNSADTVNNIIVSEALVKEAGWSTTEAVGRSLDDDDDATGPFTIIGVVKDYHFVSLKEKIGPQVFVMDPEFNYGNIWVRIDPNDIPGALRLLENTFKRLVPFFPYKYDFMDTINTRAYESEAKWKLIIGFS